MWRWNEKKSSECFRLQWLALGLLAVLLSSCSQSLGSFTKQCVVNADQASTFLGHWQVHPVPLAVQAVDFSPSELIELEAAIGTWNTFFKQSKGFSLYLNGSSPLSMVSAGGARPTSQTICSQHLVNTKGFLQQIMIYKVTSGWSYGTEVIGLTSACPTRAPNATYATYYAAMMEINFQNFFNAGQRQPDLQTIVTHELGHLLGLGHSCDGAACSAAPQEYYDAIMYPSADFTGLQGQSKRILQVNDQQRANCLY